MALVVLSDGEIIAGLRYSDTTTLMPAQMGRTEEGLPGCKAVQKLDLVLELPYVIGAICLECLASLSPSPPPPILEFN